MEPLQVSLTFDDIGNRTSTKAGGDSVGGSLRSATYGANTLNQYTNRTVSGTFDVLGIAHAAATTTVNSASTYRKGEYFHKAISVDNSTGAVYQAVTVQASATNGTDTTTGNVFLPKTAEVFTYDADGNLTSDGHWTNQWDAENRLIEMQPLSTIPSGAKTDLKFTYDSQGRRISKTVSNWTGSAWALLYDNRFVYDGWNLIAELNSTNAASVCSYMWGVDLTGSVHGAGGVGGLVGVTPQGNGTHFAAFDGNGNVIALVSGSGGSASANYEYGPFAEPIRQSGSMTDLNAVRYSTRFSDSQSDLLYVGYRFFSPLTGRWLRRDPAQERYEANLYRFVANNPISFIDPWGLAPSFSSDFGKCKLYARVNWTVTFLQPRNLDNIRKIPDEKARSEILSNLSWSDEEMQNWKRVAKNIVQYYFNEQPFKCVPCTKPCTTCPGGITVVVSLDFDGGDNVSVEKPNRERDDSTHLSANSIETGESEYGGNLYYQVTILHEVGHQLGMTHPGQKIYPRAGRNLAADYNADPDSLMGLGLTLRKEDFDQAFCRRILSPNAGCNPWKATEK